MSKVIVVPHYEEFQGPLIFLAGPIQGAADWQAEAIQLIREESPELNIATPRSPPPWHGDFHAQTVWEHVHLERAARHGVIMFWLAKEHEHVCERAYAQTSRFELGWKMQESIAGGNPLVVGFEPGFSNERYLRFTLCRKAPHVPLCSSLSETCRLAVRLCPG